MPEWEDEDVHVQVVDAGRERAVESDREERWVPGDIILTHFAL